MSRRRIGRRSLRHLSIFLGSPGDVADERRAAHEVVTELLDHPLLKGKISIELVAWTQESPMEANGGPQQAVIKWVGRPSECDLTIILLSGRLGTPSAERKSDGSPYRSGTEWEFEDARRANKPIFLYVRKRSLQTPTDEEHAQRAALHDFLAELSAAHIGRNEYASVMEFRSLFREHLLRFVARLPPPRSLAWLVVAMVVLVACIYVAMPGRPTLKVESVGEQYLMISDAEVPDSAQAVRVLIKKTVADQRPGDECFAQASNRISFAGPRREKLEEASSVFESSHGCEQDPWNFIIPLTTQVRVAEWRGWVRIALRRGNRIFESEPVSVEVATADETPVSVQRSIAQ